MQVNMGYRGRLTKQPYKMTRTELYGSPADPTIGYRERPDKIDDSFTGRKIGVSNDRSNRY